MLSCVNDIKEEHQVFPGLISRNQGYKRNRNVTASHLSRIGNNESSEDSEVDDNFLGETLMEINTKDEHGFADFANYLVSDVIPKGMTYQQKNKFFSDLKHYFWEEPYLFKVSSDGMIRRCVSGLETQTILDQCHHGDYGPNITAKKVLDSGFRWPTIIKEAHTLVCLCEACQKTCNISKRNEIPLNNIQVCEIFDIWGIDFMRPFPKSYKFKYILVDVDYVSKWAEAQALATNDAQVVFTFLKRLFCHFEMPKALISDRGFRKPDFVCIAVDMSRETRVCRKDTIGPCNSLQTTLLVCFLNGILNKRQEKQSEEQCMISPFSSTTMGDANPIRTLRYYSKPSHEGYMNTIELPDDETKEEGNVKTSTTAYEDHKMTVESQEEFKEETEDEIKEKEKDSSKHFDTFPTMKELRLHYNWIMRKSLGPRRKRSNPGKIFNFILRVKGLKVFVGNFTYECEFMVLKDTTSVIDHDLGSVIFRKPFVEATGIVYDKEE
uniref:Reverse transcriptase domain-containing protein n=1 Tax=Tanacetum cinerariifolium TaxID=118510 RepID=A0A6L2JT90_TANCI|nr:reverse transcriptase domain-containing protein [Tanacetum cinerariifolium]